MLGASARRNDEVIDLRGVGDESIDVGLPGGRALSALTEAAVLRDELEIETARAKAVAELGSHTTMRAAAVAGNFEMMNRLLDAVGVGPNDHMKPTGDRIGVPLPDRFR
jgi:hypothetical protein